jgi:ATP-dependent RNA helicase DeaD
VTIVEPREQRLLRNIEQLTKSRIEMATVPTVGDLRMQRLERTRVSIQEVLSAGDLDLFRVLIESLAEKFDPTEVAAAAAKLAYQSHGGEREEEEVPALEGRREEPYRMSRRPTGSSEERARGARTGDGRGKPFGRPGRGGRSVGMAKLHIAAGRTAGIRPGDLVGAIANEAGLNSSMIGAIEVLDRFSLVEVPEELARGIIDALGRTRIKGQKVAVRLFRD